MQSQVGVISSDVRTAADTLRVAQGDAEGVVALAHWEDIEVRRLRFGVFVTDSDVPACGAAVRAVEEAAAALTAAGAQRVDVRLPDLSEATRFLYGLFTADRGEGLKRVLAGGTVDRRLTAIVQAASAGPLMKKLIRLILLATGRRRAAALLPSFGQRSVADEWRLHEAVFAYRERFLAATRDIDLLVSPPSPLPAFQHGASEELGAMGAYCALYNVLGWPAGVVPWTTVRPDEAVAPPVGRDPADRAYAAALTGSAGLPIGVQVAAKPWRDHLALAGMAALEASRARPLAAP